MATCVLRVAATLLGAAFALLGAFGAPAGGRAVAAPAAVRQTHTECAPRDTAIDPEAPAVRVTSPATGARAGGRLEVAVEAAGADPQTGWYLALRDAAGGTLAEQFGGADPAARSPLTFSHTFSFAVGWETPACVWVYLSLPEPQLVALVPVTLVPLPGPPASEGRPSPFFANNTGPDLKQAAIAYVSERSTVPIVRSEILRVVKNFAAVRVYPPEGVTDPATVILTRPDAIAAMGRDEPALWTGVTYGTAGLCFDESIPPILCEYDVPYGGQRAILSLDTLDASVGRRTYAGRGFVFDYPADGRTFEVPSNPFKVRVQKFLPPPAFSAALYDIEVEPVFAGPGTLDEWGYTRMIAETSDLSLCPVTGTFFQVGDNAVFQVDCVTGAALRRRFFVTTRGQLGGPATQVTITIPPEGLNPWAPAAERAVTLLLATLRLGE